MSGCRMHSLCAVECLPHVPTAGGQATTIAAAVGGWVTWVVVEWNRVEVEEGAQDYPRQTNSREKAGEMHSADLAESLRGSLATVVHGHRRQTR